jgi:hypothetical protein
LLPVVVLILALATGLSRYCQGYRVSLGGAEKSRRSRDALDRTQRSGGTGLKAVTRPARHGICAARKEDTMALRYCWANDLTSRSRVESEKASEPRHPPPYRMLNDHPRNTRRRYRSRHPVVAQELPRRLRHPRVLRPTVGQARQL